MRLSLSFLGLLSTLLLVSATTHEARHVHERRSALPQDWHHVARAPKDFSVPLRFNLRQSNLHRAEELLMEVSDPSSSKYGQHYTPEEVADLFAPAVESVDSIMNWLKEAGIATHRVKYNKHKGSIHLDATVAEAEELLGAEYQVYKHSTGQPHVACEHYSLPKSVRPHVDFVTPTVHFDAKITRRGDNRDVKPGTAKSIGKPNFGPVFPKTDGFVTTLLDELKNCDTHTTPICLEALYKFEPYTQLASQKNSYGIVEFTPQSYLPGDLDMFYKNYSKRAIGNQPTGYRPILASIDGGDIQTSQQGFGLNGESDLDLQYAVALVHPTPVTLYQVGDFVMGASFNNFLDGLDASYCTSGGGNDPTQDGIYPDTAPGGYTGEETCGKFKPTNVISVSYAYNEADLTPAYEERQCNEYLKLGLQGVTVLFSSGDYGVAGNGGDCIDPATGGYDPNGIRFNPSFPGTCPYITSVGATQLYPGQSVLDAESTCETVIYSGGGFSNVFPMPDYQKSAVASYFKNYEPTYNATQYNNTRLTRGFPDISANGANYVVAVDGKFSLVFGTSASSPVVGSIITLLNDARLALGKKPVGFINPALYKNPWMLNDIKNGTNPGCGTPGFAAVPGWDPVTGLGTPNFPKMLASFLLMK